MDCGQTEAHWGLCANCIHHRVIATRRGSKFVFCQRSETDPAFPKYPRLPVTHESCTGFEGFSGSSSESPSDSSADSVTP